MSFTEEFLKERQRLSGSTSTKKKKSGGAYDYASDLLTARQELGLGDIRTIVPNDLNIATDITTVDDIGPVKRTWFQKGAFEDGYQFGDIIKTIAGTTRDAFTDLGVGVFNIAENTIDAGATLLSNIPGWEDELSAFVAKDIIDEKKIANVAALSLPGLNQFDPLLRIIEGESVKDAFLNDGYEEDSFLGERSDSIAQSGGQLLLQMGLQGVGVPWWVTSAVSSYGSQAEQAFQEGATAGEANWSALISAGAEVLSEKIFGGFKFQGKALSDGLSDIISRGVSNKLLKGLMKFGLDAGGESIEEVFSSVASRFGQWLTYQDDKTIGDMLFSEEAFDEYLESAIGGGLLGGGNTGINIVQNTRAGRDPVSGLNATEEQVVRDIYDARVAEAEKGGKVSEFDKNKIWDEVVEQMDRGEISIDDIERILGGETYKTYQDTVSKEDAIWDEYKTLHKMERGKMTGEQLDREAELRKMTEELDKSTTRAELADQLKSEVLGIAKDSRLMESYNERVKKGQAFEADVSKYSESERKTIQDAIDSGILNNTRKTHEFVDWVAKVAGAKGIEFKFTNNENLRGTQFEVITEDGKTRLPNGYRQGNTIGINTNSKKNVNVVAGHEITHVLEGTALYQALQDAVFRYAVAKDGQAKFDQRLKEVEQTYKGVTEDAKGELTADLVGEYLFTDKDFIKRLTTENRSLAQKIFDEIKYICKLATAGSREKKELERVKKAFEKAYREVGKSSADDASKHLENRSIQFNISVVEKHKKDLQTKYDSNEASIGLDEITKRYDKLLDIWNRLGGELDSKFLEDWNNKTERPFTIFKAQSGYKYNVELSSMCKKGIPLFEAIDTIVKKEVMKELNTDVIGKAEKEILYDILKSHHFEIPCAICYVEQARQREGVIIDSFLNGKPADNKGKGMKLGWNQVLDSIEAEMKANGVDFKFQNVTRDIATDKYVPSKTAMDDATTEAFHNAVLKLLNAEITRSNKAEGKKRSLLKEITPEALKVGLKGTLPSNLKIFKTLLTEPQSRFRIANDLLYSSQTTRNLSVGHHDLYSLFNSQGGVSGYKTKQGTTIYWGEILKKTWTPDDLRKEGGVRNQSNSDFQMYTLIDQAQMYMDFTARGYYLQAYTKVLSELKLFGLSKGKINASLIPKVVVYKNADGSVDMERTMASAGLDENGNPIYDDIEGINHSEAFMLLEDPEYSKNIGGICIGYSDAHIEKLLDDDRVQQIIGFHDKTDDPDKRYRGARYAHNYNGENEAVKIKPDGKTETVHVKFNTFVRQAEKRFQYNAETESFEGTTTYKGKEYTANDIPRLATDMYLAKYDVPGKSIPAYDQFKGHRNYYKLLADFSLYDSLGNYAPHRKVEYNMPDRVPYLDKNGNKQFMKTEDYIKAELQKELTVRDDIAEALADTSEEGIIPQFKERVNALHAEQEVAPTQMSLSGDDVSVTQGNYHVSGKDISIDTPYSLDYIAPIAPKKTINIVKDSRFVPGTKKNDGIWSWAKEHLLDNGMVFEEYADATGNREIDAKWNFIRNAPAAAQHLIGEGDKEHGVKSLKSIKKAVEKAGKMDAFDDYMLHKLHIDRMTVVERGLGKSNVGVWGNVAADESRKMVEQYEKNNPEFLEWAEEIYTYNEHLRNKLVEAGIITQNLADKWEQMFPHYVPIRRKGFDEDYGFQMESKDLRFKTPLWRFEGSNRLTESLFDTIGERTLITFKAVAKNNFGVELMNSLGSEIESNESSLDDFTGDFDMDAMFGEHEGVPTYTVFQDGKRVTFGITEEMYEAMKPSEAITHKAIPVLSHFNNFFRNVTTQYNPVFALTNAVKDFQDVIINSQHAGKTYANILSGKALAQIAKKGEYYQEYLANGGKTSMFFDEDTRSFKEESMPKKVLDKVFFLNDVIETVPRLAEYIASRDAGKSIEESMLDSARVTTNFAAGGDWTKFFNRNGCTFLNASVQGALQQVRNVKQAHQKGVMGYVSLLTRCAIGGLVPVILNNLMWDDDEEYEQLSDYVKEGYYIVGKYGDGKFIRIPKGRTLSVLQEAIDIVMDTATGDDEVDLARFMALGSLALENIAPNNPIENNIFAPVMQTFYNRTWYGEELVPDRLANLPYAEQFDEKTDSISKWLAQTTLGQALNWSPYKINYLLNTYSGGIGDFFLPMITPRAESGDDSLLGKLTAPVRDKFVTDSVLNSQIVTDFYDVCDELERNANSMHATELDAFRQMYIQSVCFDTNELYAEKRAIQSSDMPDSEKYHRIREIQDEINAMMEEALNSYQNPHIDGLYAEVGSKRFNYDEESGNWYPIRETNADGSPNWYYEMEQKVTQGLGISYGEYWNNREEYNFAYEKPGQYAVSQAVGGYQDYQTYHTALWDIKADKDENGKSINGTRKKKVVEYINGLDCEYGMKIILYKSEYPSDDEYNYDIIEYLNSRDDISYEQMETILKELGFNVSSDGRITW